MGIGDDIMLTALIRKKAKEYKEDVKFVPVMPGDNGRIMWNSSIYRGNPLITESRKNSILYVVRPRHYIADTRYDDMGRYAIHHLNLNNKPGNIYLTKQELEKAKKLMPFKFVTIDPHCKTKLSGNNRQWGFDKWQMVVNAFPDINFVQTSGGETNRWLEGVHKLKYKVRIFLAIIGNARFHIGNESGTIHMATAQGVKCLSIHGGYNHPTSVGYNSNVNIYVEHEESPCNRYYECEHCKWCMDQISPEMIIEAVKQLKKELY